jgi:hypothetical protein
MLNVVDVGLEFEGSTVILVNSEKAAAMGWGAD